MTIRTRWVFLLLAALAATAMLFAACGDDDDGGDDDTSPTATADDGGDDGGDDGDDDGDDGGEETDEPTDNGGDDGGDDGGGAFADLEQLANEYETATGTVTYTFNSTDSATEGTWTIYSEGENSRIDFESDDGSFIVITTPAASYTCTEAAGDGFCFEGEGGVGSNPFAGLFTQFASSGAILGYANLFTDIDLETSSEEIAGVDASCFSAEGDFGTDVGTIKWCFADSGLLLLSAYEFEDSTFQMLATAYSPDVPGGIFDPPYEATTFGQ